MKKIDFLKHVVLGVTLSSVTMFNVVTVWKKQIVDFSMTSLEALGEDYSGEGAGLFKCESLVVDTYNQSGNCQACGNWHINSKWITYDCSTGTLPVGSCKTGYETIYYDCTGNKTGYTDMTNNYICTLY